MARQGLVFAALLLALSARAQVEVRPAATAPSAPAPLGLAPAAVLAPPAALGAAFAPLPIAAVAPSPVEAAAAPLPPAEARAAAIGGALADFVRTDLQAAPAGEARDAGETLMLRALGAPVPAFAAAPAAIGGRAAAPLDASGVPVRRAEPKVYLLSKPLRETVRLGPLALAAHIGYTALHESVNAILTYTATRSVAAVAVVLAADLALAPVALAARTLGHLGQRYWRRKLSILKELALAPGVARVKILTAGPVTFWGPFALSKDNNGLIFVEADGALPETLGRFGSPIPLGDVASSRMRLSFARGESAAAAAWSPTLEELLRGLPIPADVAEAWRARSKSAKGLDRVEATLVGADGTERAIGSIAEGAAAHKLIGLGKLDRARAVLGLPLPGRSIPLSEAVVERPGRAASAKGALRRAWRRLTGRLIVSKP